MASTGKASLKGEQTRVATAAPFAFSSEKKCDIIKSIKEKEGDREMAEKKKPGRKADPSLKTEKGYYESQKTASKKWASVTAEGNEEKANRKITLRMTEAKRQEIQVYMKAMHDKYPDNSKYALNTKGLGAGTPNMNAFIMALIEEEMARNPVE